jgi:cell division protein FtsB
MKTISKKQNMPLTIFLFSLFAFVLSQLIINSILSPLGIQLQSLNSEKNYLVEENRLMEEEIAKTSSIHVIKELANRELNISSSSERFVIYVEDTSIIAERQ